MKRGLAADIAVDVTGKTYKGHIDSDRRRQRRALQSCCHPKTPPGNYVKVVQRIPVKIVFEKGETGGHELRPGMSVVPKVWIK